MTYQTTERKKLRIGTDIEYLHFVMSGFGKSIKVVSPQPASINICHKMKTCNVFLLHSLWPLATAGNSDATGLSGVVEIWRKLIKRLKREHTLKYTHVQDRNDDPCLRGESLLRKFRNKLKWNLNLNLKTCEQQGFYSRRGTLQLFCNKVYLPYSLARWFWMYLELQKYALGRVVLQLGHPRQSKWPRTPNPEEAEQLRHSSQSRWERASNVDSNNVWRLGTQEKPWHCIIPTNGWRPQTNKTGELLHSSQSIWSGDPKLGSLGSYAIPDN